MKNQIKTFEEACQELNLDAEKVIPDFSAFPEGDKKAMQAHAKLIIIVKAANKLANNGKEWTPNFTDFKERKYYPWFDLEAGGSSAFRCDVFAYWRTTTDVGSRLCFLSSELCNYIVNQFIDLYQDYIAK